MNSLAGIYGWTLLRSLRKMFPSPNHSKRSFLITRCYIVQPRVPLLHADTNCFVRMRAPASMKMASSAHSKLQSSAYLLTLLAGILLFLPSSAQPLSPSQSKTLLRLQRLLEYQSPLAGWSPATDFCTLPPSPAFSISCSGGRVTALSIAGAAASRLSPNFSSESVFTTLSRLPDLAFLSLVSLGLWGPLSPKVDRFAALRSLNLSSNFFSGEIPTEISKMSGLEILDLSSNSFNGTVPDLRPLTALVKLNLSANRFGTEFPTLSRRLQTLLLRNNNFVDKIPPDLTSFDHLQKLDLSSNKLHGLIPAFLFSLPSMQYLDLSNNRLVGEVPANSSCIAGLGYVDISNNLLVGGLPSCIKSNSSNRIVMTSGNCLNTVDLGFQHPSSYCNQGALAAVLPSANKISGSKSNLGLIFGIVGGVIAGAVLVGLLGFLIFRKVKAEDPESAMFQKPNAGKALIQVAPRSPADARHMSHAMMTGTLGVTSFRLFTIEELEEATNSFDFANMVEDGPRGQCYKGWLRDGTWVAVRCSKLKQKFSRQSLIQYMDIVSKLRHRHLVSIVGYCAASSHENVNTTDTVFLVSEYIDNGNLRTHLHDSRKREMMQWPQRVSAVIGIARGIQFLHSVTVPGIVGNGISTENILLDRSLTAKISNYNLPALPNFRNNKVGSQSPLTNTVDKEDLGSVSSAGLGEKEDIYQLGLILLEVITGKSAESNSELDALRAKLEKILVDNPANLKALADPAIHGSFAIDSLSRAIEVSLSCISKDPKQRLSIDDVLWNLQYSVQVQDDWASSESSGVLI